MLMVLGGWFAVTGTSGRALHGLTWLRVLAGAYLVFAMAITLMRHSPTLAVYLPDIVLDNITPTDKENLAPYRVVHFLALAFLATHLVPADHPGLQLRPLQAVIRCGEEWLAVFCVGVFLSFAGHLILITGANLVVMQIAVSLARLRGDGRGRVLHRLVEAAGPARGLAPAGLARHLPIPLGRPSRLRYAERERIARGGRAWRW
ncbi:hypothetical protein ACVWWR_004123 [Bradyrhizobium sp. LM3.2]